MKNIENCFFLAQGKELRRGLRSFALMKSILPLKKRARLQKATSLRHLVLLWTHYDNEPFLSSQSHSASLPVCRLHQLHHFALQHFFKKTCALPWARILKFVTRDQPLKPLQRTESNKTKQNNRKRRISAEENYKSRSQNSLPRQKDGSFSWNMVPIQIPWERRTVMEDSL